MREIVVIPKTSVKKVWYGGYRSIIPAWFYKKYGHFPTISFKLVERFRVSGLCFKVFLYQNGVANSTPRAGNNFKPSEQYAPMVFVHGGAFMNFLIKLLYDTDWKILNCKNDNLVITGLNNKYSSITSAPLAVIKFALQNKNLIIAHNEIEL